MSKLYEELRRRNVFRVGATYMVLAWLLMQFASIVLPTFDAPRWLLQAMHQHVSAGTFFPADLRERYSAFLFAVK